MLNIVGKYVFKLNFVASLLLVVYDKPADAFPVTEHFRALTYNAIYFESAILYLSGLARCSGITIREVQDCNNGRWEYCNHGQYFTWHRSMFRNHRLYGYWMGVLLAFYRE